MKKIISVFMICCLIFIVGCNDVNSTNKNEVLDMENKIAYTGNFDLSSKIINNDKQKIDFCEIDMSVYSDLLFYSNPSISTVKSNIEYIDSLCSIKQLRKNKNDDNVYYCKFSNEKDELFVYVFFENDNEFSTIGLVDMTFDDDGKTTNIINNVGNLDKSLINGIASVDLPIRE